MHILVVDDHDQVRSAMVQLLNQAGHTTCWSSSGRGALRLLRSEQVDLMLLDIMLPDISGWDVRRDQLSDPKTASIPVIVISSLDVDMIRSPNTVNPMATVQLVVTKPVDMEQLLRAIGHIGELAKFR